MKSLTIIFLAIVLFSTGGVLAQPAIAIDTVSVGVNKVSVQLRGFYLDDGYVEYKAFTSGNLIDSTDKPLQASWMISNLDPNTKYEISAEVFDSLGTLVLWNLRIFVTTKKSPIILNKPSYEGSVILWTWDDVEESALAYGVIINGDFIEELPETHSSYWQKFWGKPGAHESQVPGFSWDYYRLQPGDSGSFAIVAFTDDGERYFSNVQKYKIPSLSSIDYTPMTARLFKNYPNPFNPETMIPFSLSKSDYINLSVYDVLGRKIVQLIDGQMTAGEYSIKFDASNLPSGLYFYRLATRNSGAIQRSFVLMK